MKFNFICHVLILLVLFFFPSHSSISHSSIPPLWVYEFLYWLPITVTPLFLCILFHVCSSQIHFMYRKYIKSFIVIVPKLEGHCCCNSYQNASIELFWLINCARYGGEMTNACILPVYFWEQLSTLSPWMLSLSPLVLY
jgi:hypothetical protein